MATYDEYMKAARAADAVGDEASARQLVQAATRLKASVSGPEGGVSTNSAAVGEFEGKMRALGTGAANGASFGFGDNIAAAIGGAGSAARGQGFKRGYDDSLEIVREGMGRDRAAHPAVYGAGNIAGAMVPAAAAIPASTGANLFRTILRSSAIGSAEGAAAGAGNADGENVGESAAYGGLIGAALGGAAPVGVAVGTRASRALSDPATGIFDMMTGRASQSKANRAITDTFNRSGKSPEEVARAVQMAAREGQTEYRLMDALGSSGQRTANGIVRGGDGPSSREIADFLESRQIAQPERVSGFVDDAFGMGGKTAEQTKGGMAAVRKAEADQNYAAARGNAAPVDVRGALAVIDRRIGGMKGSGVSGDSIDGKLSRYRSRLAADAAPDGEISRELSDFDRVLGVKQEIQDDIGAAARAGRGNEARELGNLLSELDAALEASSDMYRTANDSFRNASRAIDAVDDGVGMSRPSRRGADTVSQFQRMTPDQQSAARVGYGDSLLSRIEANPSPTADKAKALRSPKRDAEARAMALDPDVYGRRLGRETEMWQTQNRALGGSQTADNLQDIKAGQSSAGGLMRAGQQAANFQFGDAVSQVMAVLGPAAKGQTEATRQLVSRALMSNDPIKALAPALKQDKTTQMRLRFIEAILRNTGSTALN